MVATQRCGGGMAINGENNKNRKQSRYLNRICAEPHNLRETYRCMVRVAQAKPGYYAGLVVARSRLGGRGRAVPCGNWIGVHAFEVGFQMGRRILERTCLPESTVQSGPAGAKMVENVEGQGPPPTESV